mmetsp:Transcript_7098/g.11852  ORF Transcript_7098/g.11852 Transcript_7098/m.11852 type:complete len:813 (-) Transcript_7098:57-2495(-)
MAKSKNQPPPPAPPLPPWQRLHKPIAPPKTSEEIVAETAAAEEANTANNEETPPAAAAASATAAGGPPTDPPSDEPNPTKISGEVATNSKNNTLEEDSDDEPIFKDFKAVKCPRTSVSAEAYAKRWREGDKGAATTAGGGAKQTDDDASNLPRRGTRDCGGQVASHNTNEASADDIDALAITVAESSESFDVAAAVAKMPSRRKKTPAAKTKASPKKKSSSAKATKKSAVKSAEKKSAAAAATPTKRSSTRDKDLPEGYLNALENGLDEEETTPASSSPQRSSRRQRTQTVSSAAHGEHTSEEQQEAPPAKKSSRESKKRKSTEPPAGAKTKKVGKKSPAPKKTDVEESMPPLPPISPRVQHVTAKMEATWNERLTMLKEHKAKYGTTDLTVAERKDVTQLLRSFVFEQRKQHKKYMSGKHSSLTAERIKELSDLGFEFDPMSSGTHKANNMRRFQEQWDVMYDELVQFKNVHGHTLVPLGKNAKEELKKLGNWVRGQRKQMNKVGREKFDPSRLTKLESIGFDWNPLSSGTYTAKKRADLFPRVNAKWMSWYNKLKGFKEKHGHIIVGPQTKNYPGLYNWVHGQRKEYVKYQRQEPNVNMYEEWVKLLNDLGFDWAPMSKGGSFSDMLKKRTSKNFETKWDSHYKDLCKFQEENGHCYVFRSGDNTTLAGWVHCQRKQKKLLDDGKHSQLNSQRIELLEKIGFDWRPSESGGIEKLRSPERNLEWDQLFEKLKDYKEKTGHCSPKKKVPRIGNWVSSQRRLWARNQKGETTSLTEERIAKLESIGFEFTSTNEESAAAEDDNFSVYSGADC